REQALVARRDLVEDHDAKRVDKRREVGIVTAQKLRQLARRLPARHVVCSAVESWRKKSSASFFAVASTRREPTAAIRPPTWTSASHATFVASPLALSAIAAEPRTKPGPPFPSKASVSASGGRLSRMD